MRYLIFDIETIPIADLGEAVEAEFQRKFNSRKQNSAMDDEDLSRLIRSTSPFFGQVLCIALRWYDSESKLQKDKVIFEDSEESTLRKFFDIINHPSTHIVKFVHYNGLGFDIPFLVNRAVLYQIPIKNNNFMNLRRFTYASHLDLMMFLSNWDRYSAPNLNLACLTYGIPSPKTGEVKGDSITDAIEAGKKDEISEYAAKDVEATFQLFLKLQPYIH